MTENDDESRKPTTAEMEIVKGRIQDVQATRRDRIRWQITKHTAELAIAALADPRPYRRSGKHRRRKRAKRLL
ncbi:MAG TPA: hypothetical protein VIV65_07850 [Gemmatimonadaceae bacterium]